MNKRNERRERGLDLLFSCHTATSKLYQLPHLYVLSSSIIDELNDGGSSVSSASDVKSLQTPSAMSITLNRLC